MAAPKQTNDRRREQVKARKLALETGQNRAARRSAMNAAKAAPVATNELKAKAKAKKAKDATTGDTKAE